MPIDSRQTDEITALLAVETHGSFVAAGKYLQRHPSILSKRLSTLEARLGVRLVERSTRHVSLTDAGKRLAAKLRQATVLIEEAQQEATSGAAQVRGHMRIAVPGAMGRLWLAPRLPSFLLANPDISLEISHSERFVDVISEGFDAAIRVGELNDSRLIATPMGNYQRILCASSSYLERHGYPSTPQCLVNHNCLGFSGLSSHPNWRLIKGREKTTVRVSGSLTGNDGEALLHAAIAGVGILGAGDWLFDQALKSGEVVQVLPEWTLGQPGRIYLIRPSRKYTSAVTHAFKDWLNNQFDESTGA
ncbi:LysR family transcriptional regulator [Halomonas campaniensis]|uniref:LysR family transcriptional regulator n=1 Tax=Halomonas campaniensis TaxID=213554 RepID=A0A246S060_9GAMM|nr:LysR family transcriptional regulator [Halomonas campaniensis]OWV29736.1 LysR family transcriptional regulator [Halomonas campaniensis]